MVCTPKQMVFLGHYLSLLKLRSSLFAVLPCLWIRSCGILSMSSPINATCGEDEATLSDQCVLAFGFCIVSIVQSAPVARQPVSKVNIIVSYMNAIALLAVVPPPLLPSSPLTPHSTLVLRLRHVCRTM